MEFTDDICSDTISESDLVNFKTVKLSDTKYVIMPADTITLGKPVLKYFKGKVNGKDVQLWLRYSMLMGEEVSFSHYDYMGTWYMEGDDDLTGVSFESKPIHSSGAIYAEEGDDRKLLYGIYYTPSDNEVLVRDGSKKFILEEADIRFEAYDIFVYENNYCQEQNRLIGHWSYDYGFVVNNSSGGDLAIPEFFEKDSSSETQICCHEVKTDVNRDDSDEGSESCFRSSSQSYRLPVYMDSVVCIITDFGYVDMGGAHGIFATLYENYDMKTGRQISLTDILDMDSDSFIEYQLQKLKKKYDFEGNELSADQVDLPSGFYMLPTGLCLIYPPYSLLGGFWEKDLLLPFEELKPYLKKQYYN
ncbi:hypothetical protein LJC00_02530 [Dysgonomonas sp. OttesenSCG-928-M03]|nr:hypothetical protein [Dysgonomonas sp. OttesenSCG-928-M03]